MQKLEYSNWLTPFSFVEKVLFFHVNYCKFRSPLSCFFGTVPIFPNPFVANSSFLCFAFGDDPKGREYGHVAQHVAQNVLEKRESDLSLCGFLQ